MPKIDKLHLAHGAQNQLITITGDGFNDSQGAVNGIVTFDGVSAQIVKWSDKEIQAYFPSAGQQHADTINVVVTVNNTASNAVPFSIKS